MKILFIRFSSIGDIVLTTPVVRCTRQKYPDAEIHYCTKIQYSSLLTHNPYINKVHYLYDDLDALIDLLKAEKYDYIIDLHHNIRTLKVKRSLKTQHYSFPKLNLQKWLLTNFKVDMMPDKSIVERYFEAVKPLNVQNDTRGLDFFIPEGSKLRSSDVPMSHWNGFVGCVIGGSYETKKLPIEQWKKLIAQIPYPVMLLGGPEDQGMGWHIADDDRVKIYNSCGKFSLVESGELVSLAKVIVSNDTGLMHVATAFQKPVISFWGNTSPEMGMFPYYGSNNLKERIAPQSVIMENAVRCHPCSKIGYKRCPKGHFDCMKGLDMDKAAAEVVRLWNKSK